MNFIFKLWDFLEGRKTYIIAFVTLVYALTGLAVGKIDANTASILIASSCSALGLRAGISKK